MKREAVVQLAVFGENKQPQGIKAIIDTGYTGFLTLPSINFKTISYKELLLKRISAYAESSGSWTRSNWNKVTQVCT
jgi:predicted aspartyl protease